MAAGTSRGLSSLLQIILLFGLLSHTTTSEDVSYNHIEQDGSAKTQEIHLVRLRRDTTNTSMVDNTTSIPSTASAETTQNTVTEKITTAAPPTQQPTTMAETTATPSTAAPSTSKMMTSTPAFPGTTPNYTEKFDNHNYYKSMIIPDGQGTYWIDLDKFESSQITTHDTLSNAHRTAATRTLGFKFLFYGHEVDQVTIATGGFLYMSTFLHQWLTATQYIAPMMANFDTKLGNDSKVHFADNGKVFIVYWDQVHLQDLPSAGPFHFQCQLHKNGTVIFAYKAVPVAVDTIPSNSHPVKIGLSDAYYVDTTTTYNVKRRTIYEYHRVEIQKAQITSQSAVIIHPLPTCLLYKDCHSCIVALTKFDCLWCPGKGRCSNGFDRFRQDWLESGCPQSPNDKTCPPAGNKPTKNPDNTGQKGNQSGRTGGKASGSRMDVNPGIVIAILFIILAVVALVSWIVYAYKYPESRSGQWLIKYRPSQLKSKIKFWKKSEEQPGEKYQVSIEPHMDSVA